MSDDETNYEDIVAKFVRSLDVEPAGNDVFVGQAEREHPEWNRVFGGLVLGQAALAAGRTAADRALHSLHAYFLRGGEPGDRSNIASSGCATGVRSRRDACWRGRATRRSAISP